MTTHEKIHAIVDNNSLVSSNADKYAKKESVINKFFFDENHFEISKKAADVTFDLIVQNGGKVEELTPEKERKLVVKLWLTILPMVFTLSAILYIDKDAITFSSLLGTFEDMNITNSDYNNIQTLFYVGYILGQAPAHLIFQRVPISQYVAFTLATWSIISFATLGCKSYAGMATLRFLLGFFESGITPCTEHTIGMFFTLDEQAVVNPIYYISCLGIDLPFAFVAYGLQYTTSWRPWKWYWLIISILSGLFAIFSYFFYPDNPATSKLFTFEERIHIINRVKAKSRSSIEQKTFKKYQFIETLKDPISWLFFLAAFMIMLANSTTYQSSIIYTQLGFSNLTTTLLIAVQAGYSISCAIIGSLALAKIKSNSFIAGASFLFPCFLGTIIAISIPYDNKPGLLGGIFLTGSLGTAYIFILMLSHTTAAGYTKKLTRTFMFMIAYSIANIIAPQMWRPQYAPRYRVPWIVQLIFPYFLTPVVLLVIRYILKKRNDVRKNLITQDHGKDEIDYGYIDSVNDDGIPVKQQVDISMLDLTDLENKRFIYPL